MMEAIHTTLPAQTIDAQTDEILVNLRSENGTQWWGHQS